MKTLIPLVLILAGCSAPKGLPYKAISPSGDTITIYQRNYDGFNTYNDREPVCVHKKYIVPCRKGMEPYIIIKP